MKGKKKHEKNQSDSKVSVTVVECGSAAGNDGPSVFMPAGDKIPAYYKSQFGSSEWLSKSGAPPNSFVHMTPTGFMTNEAWDDMAEKLAKGIRQMPVIKEHPDYWVVLHLDGFKSHVMTYRAQATFRQYKILIVKENGHSSHVNQVFDQDCAKQGKSELRRLLPLVRDTANVVKIVDHWTLLLVVMAGQNGGRGSAWTSGFIRVNLHPKHRLPILVWLSKISSALVAAGGTELSREFPYSAEYLKIIKVPQFYAELSPDKQKVLKDSVTCPSFDWSMEKIESLPEWCQQLLQQSDNLHKLHYFSNHMKTCVEKKLAVSTDLTPAEALSRLHQSQAPSKAPDKTQKELNRDNMVKLGLGNYDIFGGHAFLPCCIGKKDGSKGCEACYKQRLEVALPNACLYRSRNSDGTGGNTPSSHLELAVSLDQERMIFKPNARDLSIGSFLSGALDVNLGKGLASRKLNLLGSIDGVAEIVNSEEGCLRRRQAAILSTSIETIKQLKRSYKNRKKMNSQVKAATRQQKLEQDTPVIKLLTDAKVLPWVVQGGKPSNHLTIPPLIQFLTQFKLEAYLPIVSKPRSKANLMKFFIALCKQQQIHPNRSTQENSKAALSELNRIRHLESNESEMNEEDRSDDEPTGEEKKAIEGGQSKKRRNGEDFNNRRPRKVRSKNRGYSDSDDEDSQSVGAGDSDSDGEEPSSEGEEVSEVHGDSEDVGYIDGSSSKDDEDDDSKHCSDEDEGDDARGEPHWRKMGLKVGELVILNGGPGNNWWVGKVVEMFEIIWDEEKAVDDPEQYQGDILVQVYTGKGLNAVFKPKKHNEQVRVWAESADQWNSEDKILNTRGKILLCVKATVGK